MEGKPDATKATPKVIIIRDEASSSGSTNRRLKYGADLTEPEYNEYLENRGCEDNRSPILVAPSVMEELFGQNWEAFLKAKGAMAEVPNTTRGKVSAPTSEAEKKP